MKALKNILVPTDFSKNALAAFRYALQLARHSGRHVHLLHAYPSFRSAFQGEDTNEEDQQRAASEAQEELEAFLQQADMGSSDERMSSTLSSANLGEAVTEYVRQQDIQLIVMGTHGQSGTRSGLLGSNTYDIAKIAPVPLLVVPEHVKQFQLENVVFFTDYRESDEETLLGMVSLFGDLVKKCTLVHIHEEKAAPTDKEQNEMQRWVERLEVASPGVGVLDGELVHGKESKQLVDETITRLNATLTLLTLVGGRNFFERLVHKSLARAIVLDSKTPILLVNEQHSSRNG